MARSKSLTATLNIIGAGRLGKTLANLWHHSAQFEIAGICNRTLPSAKAAREFIGAGSPCAKISDLPPADCWLIAVGDDEIDTVAQALGRHLSEQRATAHTVFHCSGALPAAALSHCRPARIASAHPVHSFAAPEHSLLALSGSTAALEGDDEALEVLQPAFTTLGCKTITLSAEQKVLYHSGSVVACNYLTTLMDLSLQIFAAAGIDETTAQQLLEPIVMQTARNNFSLGPARALTGPIARGDLDTIRKHLAALEPLQPLLAENYRGLGLATVDLAERAGLDGARASALRTTLKSTAG